MYGSMAIDIVLSKSCYRKVIFLGTMGGWPYFAMVPLQIAKIWESVHGRLVSRSVLYQVGL